jgi:hypothetical protein
MYFTSTVVFFSRVICRIQSSSIVYVCFHWKYCRRQPWRWAQVCAAAPKIRRHGHRLLVHIYNPIKHRSRWKYCRRQSWRWAQVRTGISEKVDGLWTWITHRCMWLLEQVYPVSRKPYARMQVATHKVNYLLIDLFWVNDTVHSGFPFYWFS